jgi:hypothetical protein
MLSDIGDPYVFDENPECKSSLSSKGLLAHNLAHEVTRDGRGLPTMKITAVETIRTAEFPKGPAAAEGHIHGMVAP